MSTENRTSQAVDAHMAVCKKLDAATEVFQANVWLAIAEKYKRMEEALRELVEARYDFTDSSDGAGDEWMSTKNVEKFDRAEKALSFDPLSE